MEAEVTIYVTVSPDPTTEDYLILDTVEHHIEEEAVTKVTKIARVLRLSPSPVQAVQVVQWLAILLIVTSNSSLIYFILRQQSKTFLDWMVIIDCCLGFNQCFSVLVVGSRIRSFCYFSPFNGYFVSILNRLLNVGIVIYRFVFVVCW